MFYYYIHMEIPIVESNEKDLIEQQRLKRNEIARKWYSEHKEVIKQKQKEYYKNNKEKCIERQKKYRPLAMPNIINLEHIQE